MKKLTNDPEEIKQALFRSRVVQVHDEGHALRKRGYKKNKVLVEITPK